MAKKSDKEKVTSTANPDIVTNLSEFSNEHYLRYGSAVLEDRAIPDYRDGMNPVNRRVMWSMYAMGINSKGSLVKSARIVGDVLGRFHPHGDQSAYDAMTKMTNNQGMINNTPNALIEGEGNWGSLSEPGAAAMRYTEARLSKFSDLIVFNKFYTPAIEFVPNYDSKDVEPLILPTLLPIVLLNGKSGMAPGAKTDIPAFSVPSILEVLRKAYKGKKLSPKLLASTLQVVSTFGGCEKPGVNDDNRTALFSKTRGSVVCVSNGVYDAKNRILTYDRFAISKFEPVLEKLSELDFVQNVQDGSETSDVYGKIIVTFKKAKDSKAEQAQIARCDALMSSKENYILNFTERYKDDLGRGEAKLNSLPLSEMLTRWVNWRITLEKTACVYWIKEDAKELHRLGLLMQAVDLIDFIVSLLKDKKLKTNDDVYDVYAKKAKVAKEDAKYVLTRPIITLRNLEKLELETKVQEVTSNKAKLQARHDDPTKAMLRQLKEFGEFFSEKVAPKKKRK